MGRSLPSLAMSSVWLPRPTDEPRLDDLPDRLLDGLRVSSLTMRKTSLQARPRRLGDRPSGERLGDGVHVGDAAVGVGGHDRVADGGERDLIPGHDRRGGEARFRLLFRGVRHDERALRLRI